MKIEKDQFSLGNPDTFLNDDYSAIPINDSDNDEPSLVIDQGQDVKPSNEVKHWEIDLSNNVILKEGLQEMLLCPERQQTARKSISTDKLDASCSAQSQYAYLLPKPAGIQEDDRWKTLPKICNFPCPICKGTVRYSANDLQKHYWLLHRGQLPNYPCEMCSFSSQDFQDFTRHLYSHRNTLAKCDICKTEGRYSLLDLTKHYLCRHSVNGHFSCEKCIFQTRDVGTFVQHMHRHSEEQFEDSLVGHTKRIGFRFNCQYCSFSSTLREQFANHVQVMHRDKLNAKDLRKDNCNMPQHTQAALKLVLKRQAAELNAQVLMKCKADHPSQPSTNCTVKGVNYTKASRADEAWPSASTTLSSEQNNGTVASLLKNAVHGPTVLKVKNNKITVPENYCAKFVGFKEVNGKRHIVIKLLPSDKPDLTPAESSKESSMNLHKTSASINVKCEATSSAANGQVPISQILQGNACSRSTPFLVTNFPVKAKFEKPNIAPSSLLEVKSMHQMPAQSASLSNAAFFASNGENITLPSTVHVLQTTSALCGMTSYEKNQNHCMPSDPTISQANGPCVNPERCSGDCEQMPLMKNGNSDSEKGLQTLSELYTTPLHKTKSVYYLQNPPASSFVPQKVGQVIQNAGNEKSTFIAVDSRLHDPCITQPGNTFSTKVRSSMLTRSLHGSFMGTFIEGDGTLNCKASNVGESQIDNRADTTLCSSEDGRLTKLGGIGTILKAHSNVITQQLAKEKLGDNLQNSNILSSAQIMSSQTVPEGSRVLIASTPQSLILPLNFANQQGLQVVAASSVSSSNLTGLQTANGVPPIAMLNKRPGVVLTFSGGAIGAVANIAMVGSQVMGSVAQSNAVDPKLSNANHSDTTPFSQPAASLLNQGTKLSIQGPFIVTNSMNTPVQVTVASPQVTGLPTDTNVCQYLAAQGDLVTASSNLQSVNLQQATQQKQPIYAFLPDGRRAVLLNYAPSGDVRDLLNANVQNQNVQPMKVEGSRQKFFLKVVKNPTTGVPITFSVQSALNTSLESLKFDGVKSVENNLHFNIPAVSSSNALSDSVLISKNSLSGSTTAFLPPAESLHPPTQLKRLSQKDSSSSAQEVHTSRRSSSLRQPVSWNLRKDNISKNNCEAAQGDLTLPETETENRNKRSRRRSKAQIEEPPRKKMSAKKCKVKSPAEEENEYAYTFEPRTPKDSTKTLRLLPFSLTQTVKCPRRNQPVVVLNHPDADFPEVINLMKTVAKFKGHVLKVSLSRRTMQALLHQTYGIRYEISTRDTTARSRRTIMPVSPVKERFVLKLTLKKTSKNNYKIVKPCTENTLKATFSCWFCGRIFDNQDEWIGHGQRHLMEATRGWNTLVQ